MPDYDQELRFGTFLTPTAADAARVVELARLSEAVGLDLVTVQDHPYQAAFLDTWTLLSVLASQTSSVRLAPNVANLPLRPPVVLARSVASLDLLSNGRVALGLGAGAFWDAIVAVGGTRLSPGEAVAALSEGIDVIRAVWDTGARSIRHDGTHYRVKGAHPGPAPAHDVEIWLGAYKPRMLAVTGAKADGWLPSMGYADPDVLPAMHAAVDEAARASCRALPVGRTPPVQHQRALRRRRRRRRRRWRRLPAGLGRGLGRAAGRTDPDPGPQHLPPGQRRPERHRPLRPRGRPPRPRPGRRRPLDCCDEAVSGHRTRGDAVRSRPS